MSSTTSGVCRHILTVRSHDPAFDLPELKQVQIAFRHAEIIETVRVLKAINNGEGDLIAISNPRHEGKDIENWKGRLAMDSITLGGHSYGATGAVRSKTAPRPPT